jgi:hypothetical protein
MVPGRQRGARQAGGQARQQRGASSPPAAPPRGERRGKQGSGAASGAKARPVGRRHEAAASSMEQGRDGMFFLSFFCFMIRVTPPGLEPAVMAQVITIEPDPTDLETGGDDTLDPAVMGLYVVVQVKQIDECIYVYQLNLI